MGFYSEHFIWVNSVLTATHEGSAMVTFVLSRWGNQGMGRLNNTPSHTDQDSNPGGSGSQLTPSTVCHAAGTTTYRKRTWERRVLA